MRLLDDINENQIRHLSKLGMTLTHFWILHLLNMAREYDKDSVQNIPELREVKLLRDRFLVDEKGINKNGQDFYKQICAIKEEELPKPKKEKKSNENRFEDFWSEYPGSANFTTHGMKFTSSRALKGNKQVCKMLYDSAIASGVATEEQIINATKFMVEQAKNESFESGTNKLSFLSGSEVYLRQQKYLAFVDVGEETSDQSQGTNWA